MKRWTGTWYSPYAKSFERLRKVLNRLRRDCKEIDATFTNTWFPCRFSSSLLSRGSSSRYRVAFVMLWWTYDVSRSWVHKLNPFQIFSVYRLFQPLAEILLVTRAMLEAFQNNKDSYNLRDSSFYVFLKTSNTRHVIHQRNQRPPRPNHRSIRRVHNPPLSTTTHESKTNAASEPHAPNNWFKKMFILL